VNTLQPYLFPNSPLPSPIPASPRRLSWFPPPPPLLHQGSAASSGIPPPPERRRLPWLAPPSPWPPCPSAAPYHALPQWPPPCRSGRRSAADAAAQPRLPLPTVPLCCRSRSSTPRARGRAAAGLPRPPVPRRAPLDLTVVRPKPLPQVSNRSPRPADQRQVNVVFSNSGEVLPQFSSPSRASFGFNRAILGLTGELPPSRCFPFVHACLTMVVPCRQSSSFCCHSHRRDISPVTAVYCRAVLLR